MIEAGKFWVPGPTEVRPEILDAMRQPMIFHRTREMAIRMAMGAGRSRIVRQLVTESLVIALAGGAAGLALALACADLLLALAPADIPRLDEVGLDARAIGFALVASLVVGLLVGLASALHASRADPGDALKEGGKSGRFEAP